MEEVGARDAGNEKIFQKPAAFDENIHEPRFSALERRSSGKRKVSGTKEECTPYDFWVRHSPWKNEEVSRGFSVY